MAYGQADEHLHGNLRVVRHWRHIGLGLRDHGVAVEHRWRHCHRFGRRCADRRDLQPDSGPRILGHLHRIRPAAVFVHHIVMNDPVFVACLGGAIADLLHLIGALAFKPVANDSPSDHAQYGTGSPAAAVPDGIADGTAGNRANRCATAPVCALHDNRVLAAVLLRYGDLLDDRRTRHNAPDFLRLGQATGASGNKRENWQLHGVLPEQCVAAIVLRAW